MEQGQQKLRGTDGGRGVERVRERDLTATNDKIWGQSLVALDMAGDAVIPKQRPVRSCHMCQIAYACVCSSVEACCPRHLRQLDASCCHARAPSGPPYLYACMYAIIQFMIANTCVSLNHVSSSRYLSLYLSIHLYEYMYIHSWAIVGYASVIIVGYLSLHT